MKLGLKPRSLSGKWAVGFAGVLVVSSALSLFFALAIGGNSEVIANNPTFAILAGALSVVFTLAGPLSFIFGVYTFIKHKEYSAWKPLAISYILAFLLFMLGEFLFPH